MKGDFNIIDLNESEVNIQKMKSSDRNDDHLAVPLPE
jgi:hypothetical protein